MARTVRTKFIRSTFNKAMCFIIVYTLLLSFLIGTTAGQGTLKGYPLFKISHLEINSNLNNLVSINRKLNASIIASSDKSFEKKAIYSQGFAYSEHIPLSRELQEYIFTCAKEQNLDYTLVLALIWRESRFEANAIGYNTNGTKDSGLMQINDVNRQWLKANHGIVDLIDPKENVRAGTSLLGMFASKHGQHYGLLAYEWGEGGMSSKKSAGVTTSALAEQLYQKKAEYDRLIYG